MLFMIMVVNRDIRERFTLSCVVIETQCYNDDQYKPGTKQNYSPCFNSLFVKYIFITLRAIFKTMLNHSYETNK